MYMYNCQSLHCSLLFFNKTQRNNYDLFVIVHVIYEQRERVFHRDIQTRENNV